jgi:hypothetical protein
MFTEDSGKRMKRQGTDREKIFKSHITNQDPESGIKNSQNSIT